MKLSIKTLCVLGGTGYLGQACVRYFSMQGYRVIVPSRRPERFRELAIYPRVTLVRADVMDSDLLSDLLQGVDAVINLIDLRTEESDRDQTYNRINVEFVRKLMGLMRKQGVKRLLGLSAMNLDSMLKQTDYLRSKAQAEQAMSSSYEIYSTAIRPSMIYGPSSPTLESTDPIEVLARQLRHGWLVPVLSGRTRIAPLMLEDFTQALECLLEDEKTFGKAIELCGPKAMTRVELARRLRDFLGVKAWVLSVPRWLSWCLLPFVSRVHMNRERLINLQKDQLCSELAYRPKGLVFGSIEQAFESYDFVESQRDKYHRYRQSAQR
jgi:NADH dehydrogenase